MGKEPYKAATYFPREAREKVAEKVFVKRSVYGYVCDNGHCVVGALLRELRPEDQPFTYSHSMPEAHFALQQLINWGVIEDVGGTTRYNMERNLATLMKSNDDGELATPEAVHRALLGA